jgi:hypothetical protein
LVYAETVSGFWTLALLSPAALRDAELAPEPLTTPPISAADTEKHPREIDPVCDEPSCHSRDWHVGLNLRTDFGTHPLRIDGGARFDRFDVILVIDPMIWLDGQSDLDLMLDVRVGAGWSGFVGWRASSIGIADGRQWQQKSLLGVAGRLPGLLSGHLRAQWGLELAVLWVKHGAGLETDTISFDGPRHYLDNFNFGMFVRFEYASAF